MVIKMVEERNLPDYDRAPTNPHHGGKYSYNQWLQELIDGSVVCKETLTRGTDPGPEWFVERYNESTSVEDTITAVLLLSRAKKGPFHALTGTGITSKTSNDTSKEPKVTMAPMSKTLRWMKHTMLEIHKCGGSPDVIDKFPEDLMNTMIRNNLYVVYKKDA